jgi:bifunctional ADP-heptose synthase (sugar kinase/adenylyltransferase)
MKNLMLLIAIILSGNVFAQETPKEVKQETEVKTVKIKDSDKTTEKKVKVVTRETALVELDKKDKNKTDQNRVESTKKIEKTVFIDNNNDDNYDMLTQETYYVLGDGKYMFTPNKKGFDIAFDKNKDNDHLVKVGKAWTTSRNGYYILNGDMHSGIGSFDSDGNFSVEYYNKDTDQVEVKTYMRH